MSTVRLFTTSPCRLTDDHGHHLQIEIAGAQSVQHLPDHCSLLESPQNVIPCVLGSGQEVLEVLQIQRHHAERGVRPELKFQSKGAVRC